MFSRLIGMFVLCLSFSLFALSGEFITQEKGMPIDKIEIAGKSCIVYVGTFSNSGKYVIEDNYLTVTYKTKQIGAEGIPYEQSTDAVFKIVGDTCLIGKTAPFTDIRYIKYNANRVNKNIVSFHCNGSPEPVAPKIYKTFNQSGYNISITESYNKIIGGNVDEESGRSMSQFQAMVFLQAYLQFSSSGVVFKNYIIDAQKITVGKNEAYMPCIYVQGGNMIQKLDMMNTPEDQLNYLNEISKPFMKVVYNNQIFQTKEFIKIYADLSALYLSIYNPWFYNQAFASLPNFDSNPTYKKEITDNVGIVLCHSLFANFVVCDDNWKTKYWIDGVKESSLIKTISVVKNLSMDQLQGIYDAVIEKK